MDKEKSIKILNNLLSHLEITANQLSESIGKTRSQWIYDVLNPNKKVGISKNIAELISDKYPEISKSWLLTGEGEMLIDDAETKKSEQIETPGISYTEGKPYYDVDLLGGFDVIINDQTTVPSYLIDFKKYDDADCWCNITGHSMEPLISHGDIIAIKEMKEWREFILFGELYGIITNDMRTVKIVTRSTLGNEFLQLVPVNKSGEYQPQDIPVKLITHVFKILGCMKKL